MLRFLTSGESHGQGLVTILEGLPAGLPIDFDAVTLELRRRQGLSLQDAVVDAGAVRFRPMVLTAAAVSVGGAGSVGATA